MNKIYVGQAVDGLIRMKADGCVASTCVTSPPYFGLRDYGVKGQIGLEDSPREYIDRLVGCGIPAPALRWDPSGVWAKVLGAFFRIAYNGMKYNCLIGEEVFDQGYASIDEAREACQDYWQQLWDKEMLISRDLPVSL